MPLKRNILSILFLLSISFINAQDTIRHTAEKGETLYSISKHYGLTVNKLLSINPDKTATSSIEEGQIWYITKKGYSKTFAISPNNYTVKKGDTKYSISKKFGISIAQLEQENPEIIQGLHVNKQIHTPSYKVTQVTEPIKNINEKPISGYTKTKDVPAPTEANPKKEIATGTNTIQNKAPKPIAVVSEKAIPSEEKSNITNTNSNSEYTQYTIKPKETLYGLSKKAGVSMSEFLKINPQLAKQLVVGTVIKMPTKNPEKTTEAVTKIPVTEKQFTEKQFTEKQSAEIPATKMSVTKISVEEKQFIKSPKSNPENAAAVSDIITKKETANKKLISSLEKKSPKTIGFILPFSKVEFDKMSHSDKSEDEKMNSQINFFKGALIALEQAKKLGIPVQAQYFKFNEVESSENIQTKIKKEVNAIILASDPDDEIALLQKHINGADIPLIIAQQELEYPQGDNIFNALPSYKSEQEKIFSFLKEQNGQILVLDEENTADSRKSITDYYPEAKFIPVTNSQSLSQLSKELDKEKTNFVILNTQKSGTFLSCTTALLKETNSYKIQLVIPDSRKIPNDQKISSNRLKILKTIYPAHAPDNEEKEAFIKNHPSKHNLAPSIQVLKGYDIVYDTILRLFQSKSFKELAETEETEHTMTQFDYQKNLSGGYTNQTIYIMQTDEDGKAKIIK